VLDQLKLSASMECLTFKLDGYWFAVQDLEEDSEMMLADFFRVVKHI